MRPRLHCNFEQFSTNSYPVFAHFRSTFSSRNSTTFSAELCVVVDESWEIFNFHHHHSNIYHQVLLLTQRIAFLRQSTHARTRVTKPRSCNIQTQRGRSLWPLLCILVKIALSFLNRSCIQLN